MAFEELTSRQAVMWGSAPFENIAELISDMHVALVERLAPLPGEHWLDLGCGAGDVAFHAARAGAIVTGVRPLADARRDRRDAGAQEQGLDLKLEVADCQKLHYADAVFDVVSSSVGVIFAPDHERVAHELARVCRPGGRIGLTAWRRESGVGEMFGAMAPFMPPPPAGRGLAVPVGRRGVRRRRGWATRSSSRSRSSTRATTGETAARCGRSSATTTGRAFTLWYRSTTSAGRSSTRHGGILRELPRRDDGITRAPLHRRHGRAQGLISGRVHSSSR